MDKLQIILPRRISSGLTPVVTFFSGFSRWPWSEIFLPVLCVCEEGEEKKKINNQKKEENKYGERKKLKERKVCWGGGINYPLSNLRNLCTLGHDACTKVAVHRDKRVGEKKEFKEEIRKKMRQKKI